MPGIPLSGEENREEIKRLVWNKENQIPGRNPLLYRQDCNGDEIHWISYGIRDSDFGWEIHHVVPLSDGGPDTLDNMIPLQWRTNASFGGSLGNENR